MTWTKLNSTSSSGTNTFTTTAKDSRVTVAGRKHAMQVDLAWFTTGPTPTLSDSAGNSFIGVFAADVPGTVVSYRKFRCLNYTSSATHTITVTGTGIFAAAAVSWYETDAAGAIAVDTGKPTNNAESNSNVNVKPGTTTPTGNALVVAGAGHGGALGQACTVLTLIESVDYSGGVNVAIAQAWANRGASATDPQFSWTANTVGEHSASMDVILDGQATPSLALTEFTANEVIPVDIGQNTPSTAYATVTCGFVYNDALGTPVSARIQIYAADGTTIQKAYYDPVVAPTFNSGSGNGGQWRIQAGGSYKFKIQTYTGASGGGSVIETSSATTNTITGIGYGIIPIGQSHLSRMEDDASLPPSAPAAGKTFDGSTWSASAGNGNRQLLISLIAGTSGLGLNGNDIPFFITRTGIGGAGWGIDGGSLGVPYYTGGVYKDTANASYPYKLYLQPQLAAIRGGFGNFSLWLGGSSDAVLDQGYATTYADFQTTRVNFLALMGYSASQIPAFICVNGTTQAAGDTDAEWEACVQADLIFSRDQTNAPLAASLVDLAKLDDYHLTPAGYGRLGRRIAQSILKYLGITTVDGASLKFLTGFRYYGSKEIACQVTLNGGTKLKESDGTVDGGSVTDWQVTFDGTFADGITVSSTRFNNPNIILTASSAPANSDTVKVRYMYGANPSISNPVYDDTTPGSDTLGRVLVPSIDSITITAGPAPSMNHPVKLSYLRM